MRAGMGNGGDIGERTLERRARAAIEAKGRGREARRGARERVRGRLLFGVPLFERVKLQKFVQKCSKW
jgi:hypothetical protein